MGENETGPRPRVFRPLSAGTAGKIELEYVGEDKKEEDLIERLINRAIMKVFDRHLKIDELKTVIAYFENGWGVEVSDSSPPSDYVQPLRQIPRLRDPINRIA